ncbi:MAG: hypothetical protein HGB11_02645 [Chlorobiales bacterium]|nr:hypothetical protein [Chlorobiales bacterium]
MRLNGNTVSNLLENTFSLDCIRITLTQKCCDEPIIYSGPGTISQNSNGELHLKLYHSFVDKEKELFGMVKKTSAGKIIEDKYFFSLEAEDMEGHRWISDTFQLSNSFSFPASAKVITSYFGELQQFSSAISVKASVYLIVKGIFRIPANEIEEQTGGFSRNTFKMQNEFFNLEMKAKDDYMTIIMDGEASFFEETTQPILLEALSIIFGQIIRPVYSEFVHNKISVSTLYSIPAQVEYGPICPIHHSSTADFESVKNFIEKYLLYATDDPDLFGFWLKINRAWQGGIENRALVLTVAIEGLVKKYFSEYGYPDEEFIGQANAALNPIKSLDIGTRIKNRITSSIIHAKASNHKSSMYKLAKEGYFDKKFVDDWDELRNKSAHADKLDSEKPQEYVDQFHRCLQLFYILLFIVIKYEGLYYDFTRENWPNALFILPKSKREPQNSLGTNKPDPSSETIP